MLRFAPFFLEFALLVYCLIDAIQTPEPEVRNLPKVVWILLILIVPVVGSVAWLVAGRPQRSGAGRAVPWPATGTAGFPEYERPAQPVLGPDDDPAFLRDMKRGNDEHEQLLRTWEEDLKRRERRLREPDDGAEPAPGPDEH